MKIQCEFMAPPQTKEFMTESQMHNIFAIVVHRVVKKETVVSPSYPPVMPNYIQVAPFTTVDGEVKYVVDSSVKLGEKGRMKVRQDVFETIWNGSTMAMVNSDTGETIIEALGYYERPFAALQLGYPIEALHQQGQQ